MNAPWKPAIPLRELHPRCIKDAQLKKAAFSRTLERIQSPVCLRAEIIELGLADHKAATGQVVERRWRDLLDRTLERDGGLKNFERLEIYLPDRLYRKPSPITPERIPANLSLAHRSLAEYLSPLAGLNLTRDQETNLWLHVLDEQSARVQAGGSPKPVKRAIVKLLFSMLPSLATSEAALDKTFRRQKAAYEEKGIAAVAAQYKGNKRAPELSQPDLDAITWHAVFNCGGRICQAWRELATNRVEGATLSDALLSYYPSDIAPRRVVEAITPEVRALDDLHHGPRQYQLNGAFVSRNWGKVNAGDWLCGDDVTLPIYFSTPDGKGGFTLLRGQCLLLIDLRSNRILAWCLIPANNYNSRAIRTLITRCCDESGQPRKGLYVENGIWRTSRILTGDKKAGLFGPEITENGLREYGLKFIHARLPRAKPIERVIGGLQNLMEREPGYCGRNEILDRFEGFQKLKLAIERGADPTGLIYSLDQWEKRLGEIIVEYNSLPQPHSKMTCGLSPDDAYEMFQNPDDPQVKFDDNCRYLFAHHRRPVTVGRNGITFRVGKRAFVYRNDRLGGMRGRRLMAWFNPEMEDVLPVTDLDGKNPFCVPLRPDVPAMEDSALLDDELANIAEFQAPLKTRYNTLKALHPIAFRPMLADPAALQTGRVIAEETEAIRAEKKSVEKTRRNASRAGVGLARDIRNPARVQRGLDMLKESDAAIAADRASGDCALTTPGAKAYLLNAPAPSRPTVGLYWYLWAKIEQVKPCPNRHALTQQHLGANPFPNKMTPEQLGKMIDVFSAILREAAKPATV